MRGDGNDGAFLSLQRCAVWKIVFHDILISRRAFERCYMESEYLYHVGWVGLPWYRNAVEFEIGKKIRKVKNVEKQKEKKKIIS